MTVLDDQPGADLLAAELVWHRHAELFPAPDNLRATLTDLTDLAESIAANGLLQPLKVTYQAGRPLIVAGHRRHGAIGLLIADGRWPAGRRIQCVTGPDDLDDEGRTVAMLVENLQRVDLDPIEEAHGYRRLRDAGWKQARIATETGRPEKRITSRLALLKLPEPYQQRVSDGTLTLELAGKIAATPEPVRAKLAERFSNPTQYQLDQAISDHERITAIATVTEHANARGLFFDPSTTRFELARTHTGVQETTPAGLAKVLLPDDTTGWAVTLDHYGSKKVTIWRPTPDTPDDDEGAPAELNEWEIYENTCEAIRDQHHEAYLAWRDHKKALKPEIARNADPKEVARWAMEDVLRSAPRERLATALGWQTPTGADAGTVKASLAAWWSTGTNFVAGVALALLDSYNSCDALKARLDQAAGPAPATTDLTFPDPPRGWAAWQEGYTPDDPEWPHLVDLDHDGITAWFEAQDQAAQEGANDE